MVSPDIQLCPANTRVATDCDSRLKWPGNSDFRTRLQLLNTEKGFAILPYEYLRVFQC